MHSEATNLPVRWTTWSKADHDAAMADLRRWVYAWTPGVPCPNCLWPYESYHLCTGPVDPALKSPTDE